MVVAITKKWIPFIAFLKLTYAEVFGRRRAMFTIPLRIADP